MFLILKSANCKLNGINLPDKSRRQERDLLKHPMKKTPNIPQIILAFFLIYFIWGSTYLANAWAVAYMPSFMLAGVRFTIAGAMMLMYSVLKGGFIFDKTTFKNALFAGVMLFVVGNGMMLWTLRIVDSGIAALIVATRPLIVILLLWKMKNIKPTWNSWLGIFLGVLGMALLVGQAEFVSDSMWLASVFVILLAAGAWSYVSVWTKDAKLPESVFESSGLQLLLGGLVCLLISVVLQEYKQFEIAALTTKSIWAFAYLILFGSIIAFTAFNYLLKNVSPAKVNTCTYVNPVIAMLLGFLLNEEVISFQSGFAALLLLVGVVFINVNFASTKPTKL